VSPGPSKPQAVAAENHNFTQVARNKSRISYYKFTPLDQAGPAVIARDNIEDRVFVANYVKRADRNPIYRVPDFASDYFVNIKNIFLEGDNEIVIICEQIDLSLKYIVVGNWKPIIGLRGYSSL